MKRRKLHLFGTITVFACLLSTFFVWNTTLPALAAGVRSLTAVPGQAG